MMRPKGRGIKPKEIKDSVKDVYDIIIHVEPAGVLHFAEKFGVDEKMM